MLKPFSILLQDRSNSKFGSNSRVSNDNSTVITECLKNSTSHVVYDTEHKMGEDLSTVRQSSVVSRVDKGELMQAYVSDPIFFNSINKITEVIMAAGYVWKGDDKAINFVKMFFESLSHRGDKMDFDDLLERIFLDCLRMGNAWQELIYSDSGKCVDIDILNPVFMDFARNKDGNIVTDQYGLEVGYVQNNVNPHDVSTETKVPSEVDLKPNQIYIPRNKIVHYYNYNVGDHFDGIGLIEPAYKSSVWKLNSSNGFANSAHRLGHPMLNVKVGDQYHNPTMNQLKETENVLKGINEKSIIVTPHWYDINILEAKRPEKLKEYIKQFEDEEITATGLPAALASGSGQATNRSTLGKQEYFMKLSFKRLVRKVVSKLQKSTINVICEQSGISKPPILEWGEISIEELNNLSVRLARYVTTGLLTATTDIEDYLRNKENLPKFDKKNIKPDQNPNSGSGGSSSIPVPEEDRSRSKKTKQDKERESDDLNE